MQEIRIGVFVCHCGSNIGNIIDCPQLTEFARSLPSVVFAQNNLYTCSETGLLEIKKGIKEHHLNRVVVAACTPRTHEPLFRGVCQEMDLNPYYFEFVNIREQCTWVHQKEKMSAFEKAKDLLRMGVARAFRLESLNKIEIPVLPNTVVIGGGISGMTAALNLANQGYQIILIEREDQLGGRLNELYRLYPNSTDPKILLQIREKILSHPLITVHYLAIIHSIEGYIGNFNVSIQSKGNLQSFKIGTIIIATGSQVLHPQGLYNYNGRTVITQLELEHYMLTNQLIPKKNIVMIQCVGSRIENRSYCSNVCCMTALKNAQILKTRFPETNITILYRDIYTSEIFQEDFYREIRGMNVLFLRYDLVHVPQVHEKFIYIYNQSLKIQLEIPYDLVVLSTPMIPQPDAQVLSHMLKVPIEEHGFFLEAHVKLRPVDFSNEGIFVCGAAKWPCNVSEAMAQGLAAAARVARIISKSNIIVEGAVAVIDEHKCIGCEICIKLCPYAAIVKDDQEHVHVVSALCKGCGLCGSSCPKVAIEIKHYTNNQIFSQIAALIGDN